MPRARSPKQYGGFGAEPDILKSRIIAEEFIAAGLPMGMADQGISMLVPTLLELGTEEQKQRWIGPTLRGEIIWCQGYSEPGAGSRPRLAHDARGGRRRRLRHQRPEDLDLDRGAGRHDLLPGAHRADKPKHEGISYLLFSMKTPGIEVRPLVTMTGRAEFNEVFFTDVRVPKTRLVGGRGQGWFVANATLKHERGMLGDPNQAGTRLQGADRADAERRRRRAAADGQSGATATGC